MKRLIFVILWVAAMTFGVHAQKIDLSSSFMDEMLEEYIYLHQNPELSFQEKETSKRLADKMRKLGFEVTENVGGYGVVCVYRNGVGKTLMVRADTDALPVEEKTGVSYASVKRMNEQNGSEVPVMHACGHDVHMTVWLGAARYLVNHLDGWSGTLVFIAQPAEERSGGAKNMLKDGLFTRFPLPDHALALHVSAGIPAGMIGWKTEYALANVDMVDITIKGKGGHGAYPHATKDPIVMAAKLILDLQTIVAREIAPTDPGVVTVGSIHGGAKGNVISDEVKLELTLRSYKDEVRNYMLDALKRKCEAVALSYDLPKELYPVVTIRDEYTPALYNDIEFTKQVVESFYAEIGEENVIRTPAVMGGEDFGRYGRTEHDVPIFMFWLGAVNREKYMASKKEGTVLPSLHNSGFAPDPMPTLTTGIKAMARAAIDILHK